MAADGEERLLTLFADIHYFFGEPGPRPMHHRFDKESYVYLYRDAAQKRGRLEIANHAGTPEQDAFTGYLDSSIVVQSHRHPTLCTVVVDAAGHGDRSVTTGASEHHWRLPSTDPRDEGKYLFRLHTVDLYFWSESDARVFIECSRNTLRQEQVDADLPPPPAPHAGLSSPVVQKLESVAIADPAYHNGQTRNSRSMAQGLPPAPAAAPERREERQGEQRGGEKGSEDPAAFVPLPYNPASPPPPEKIKHREKTPPPPEAVAGTGLAAVAYHDHIQSQAVPSFAPPPTGAPPMPQAYPPTSPTYPSASPANAGLASQAMGAPRHPSGISSSPSTSVAPAAANHPSYGATSQDPSMGLYQPGTKPLDSPIAQILGPSYSSHPAQPLQHLQPQYADYLASRTSPTPSQQPQTDAAGYSDHSYDQPPGRHHQHQHYGRPQEKEHEIHNQVYRPTEEEAHAHSKRKQSTGGSQPPRRLEQRVEKVEKGVNKFFRKLEKRIG